MSSVKAITDDLIISVRMASFYPLSNETLHKIVAEVSKTMEELAKNHNFLVYRVALDRKGGTNE